MSPQSVPSQGSGPGATLDVVFGDTVFCDLVFSGVTLPGPGEEVYATGFQLSAGGTANRCVATARLGLRTGLRSCVGRDPLGDFVVSVLESEPNLDLSWVSRDGLEQTPVSVSVTSPLDRSFITYQQPFAGPASCPGPVPRAAMCQVSLAEEVPDWALAMRREGTLMFGGVGWDPTQVWSGEVLRRLSDIDVFCPNAAEAMGYAGVADPVEAAKKLARYVPLVVVTLGEEGALAVEGATGRLVHVPALPVRVLDPTGAGDVFSAGLMVGTVEGWDLADRLRFASLCAGLSVQKLGGASAAPSVEEIGTYLDAVDPPGTWTFVREWIGRRHHHLISAAQNATQEEK